jgi:CheY-like chemotaxis protein
MIILQPSTCCLDYILKCERKNAFYINPNRVKAFRSHRILPKKIVRMDESLEVTKRKNICLIENDEDTALLISRCLIKDGCAITTFDEGRYILDQPFSIPDVFIIDHTKPLINGIAVCKFLRLHEATKNIPIVFISANLKIQSKALRVGATHFIHKPIKSAELRAKVGACPNINA